VIFLNHPIKDLLLKDGYNIIKVTGQQRPYFIYKLSDSPHHIFSKLWNGVKEGVVDDTINILNNIDPLWYASLFDDKPSLSKGITLVKDYIQYNTDRYDNIINDPAQDILFTENGRKYLNLFNSTYYLSEDIRGNLVEGDWSVIRNLLWHMCEEDADLFDWVINWFSCLYQYPTYRFTTSIIFIGAQGSGKGMLSDALRYLFGETCYRANSKDLGSNFNAQLFEGKVLLLANEVKDMNNKYQFSNDLKEFVTESEISVEKKFTNRYMAKNYIKLIIFSNSSQPISIDESDRRYLVVNQQKKANAIFSYEILNKFKTDESFLRGQVEGFAHFLQNNLCDLRLIVNEPPMTRSKDNIIRMNMTDFKHIILSLIEEFVGSWKKVPVEDKWYVSLSDIHTYFNMRITDREINMKKLIINKFSEKLLSENLNVVRKSIDSDRIRWIEVPQHLVLKHKIPKEVE
jgi:hypothetical protein